MFASKTLSIESIIETVDNLLIHNSIGPEYCNNTNINWLTLETLK